MCDDKIGKWQRRTAPISRALLLRCAVAQTIVLCDAIREAIVAIVAIVVTEARVARVAIVAMVAIFVRFHTRQPLSKRSL